MPLGRMLNLRGTDNEDGRKRGTSLDRGIDMAPDMLVDMKVKPPNIKDLQKNVQNKGRLSLGILFIFTLMSITKPIEKSTAAYTTMVILFGLFIFISIGFVDGFLMKTIIKIIIIH